jgi:AraC-like DNA-binding protein
VLFPLVEVVKSWGVAAETLLRPWGIVDRDVSDPGQRFPHETYIAIVERARELTGEPGLGYAWGLQMRVSTFGFLGFATMSARTLRGALDLAMQFSELMSTAEGMRLQIEGNMASLVFDEGADFGSVRDVIMLARLIGLWRMGETLTNRDLKPSAEVAFPEPPYQRRFAHLVPPIRWEQPTTRALFKAEVLDYPLIMASPVALKIATEQCSREIQALGAGGRLVQSVRKALAKDDGFRSAEEVAGGLGMSPRTLARKLTLAGTSISALLDEERRDRALLLLRRDDASLALVAERVGYGNVQNFERAFKRWTGMTPAAYRRT